MTAPESESPEPFITRIEFAEDKENQKEPSEPPESPKRGKRRQYADKSSAKPRRREPVKRKDEFIEPLEQMYAIAGGSLLMLGKTTGNAGLEPIARSVLEQASACAIAWDSLAEKDENVRRALRVLCTGGAWGGVIAAHAPIVLTGVMAARGGDDQSGNVQPPDDQRPSTPQARADHAGDDQ